MDPRNTFCEKCKPGYQQTLQGLCTCSKPDPANPSLCTCPTGYSLNSQTGNCEISRDVCLNRGSNGSCNLCPFNFFPSSGQCVPYNCAQWKQTYPNYIECQKCIPNFMISNNSCVNQLCLNFKSQAGALFPQCTSCVDKYTPYDYYCVPNNCELSTYDISTPKCIRCKNFGFVLTDDSTACRISNCTTEQGNSCLVCDPGFVRQFDVCLANNCSNFANGTAICTSCVDGFTFSNGLCYTNFCASFDQVTICKECQTGFELKSGNTCARKYCTADSPATCLQCINGFRPDPSNNGACVPVNCQTVSRDGSTCEVCLAGMFKENNKNCVDINCGADRFDSVYKCLECKQSFQFNLTNRGLCEPINKGFCPVGTYYNLASQVCTPNPIANCSYFDNPRCLTCLPGFILYNNLCYSIRGCATYSYWYGCYTCSPDFILSDRWCISSNFSIPNCLTYNGQSCTSCASNFFLVENTCVSLPQSCAQVNRQGVCLSCVNGYTLSSNGLCTLSVPNCANYDAGNNRCSQCRSGFYLNPNFLCSANPSFCTTSLQNGQCLSCFPGYVLQNGLCFVSQNLCQVYNPSTGLCSACVNFAVLSNNACQCGPKSYPSDRTCVPFPEGCSQYAVQSGACTECEAGYSLALNRCVQNQVPENCVEYDPASFLCNRCSGGLVVSSDRKSCISCPVGYVPSAGNTCQIPGCLSYNSANQCLSCEQLFTLQNGLFFRTISNCGSYNFYNQCLQCLNGFTLYNGLCYSSIANCLAYQQDGRCFNCANGFTLSGGACWKTIQFCSTYSSQNGSCANCISGYVLSYGSCVAAIANCNTYFQSTAACETCLKGFMLWQNICIQVPTACSIFDAATRICNECMQGYTLGNDRICSKTPSPAFCDVYDPVTLLCVRCSIGYVVRDGGSRCQSCPVGYSSNVSSNMCESPFCQQYNSAGLCVLCAPGYSISSNNICYRTILNCVQYSNTGECTSCDVGFQLY